MLRNWMAPLFGLVVLIACGGSPHPQAANQNQCGVRVFEQDACETPLNSMCCAQKAQCGGDAVCRSIAECVLGCKHATPRDACVSACITRLPASPATQAGTGLYYRMQDCTGRFAARTCGDDS